MNRDVRYVRTELRAGQSEGDEASLIVDGRAIGYDKLSLPGIPFAGCKERIRPGAFAASLASGKTVLCNFNHERGCLPLGSTQNGSLLLHDIPSSGLHFQLRLDPKVSFARDVHQLVKSHLLDSCSFEFSTTAGDDDYSGLVDDEDRCTQLRSVNKAILHAVTLTPEPAYAGSATFANARSLAYAGETTRRPTMSSAEMRKRAEQIGDLIACDLAEMYGGFHEIKIGPGEADVRFEPFKEGDLKRHLFREHARLGEEIREQLLDAERREPSFVYSQKYGGWVMKKWLLEKGEIIQ